MRRTQGQSSSIINRGNLEIILNKLFAAVDEKPSILAQKEYQILNLLSSRKGTNLAKYIVVSHLYSGIQEPESIIMDIFLCKKRKKPERVSLEMLRSKLYEVKDVYRETQA